MIDFIKKLLQKYREILLYGVIGGSAALLDVGVFYLLYNFVDFSPTLATMTSVFAATIYSFTLNAFHNFRTKDRMAYRVVMFFSVSLLGLGLSALIVDYLTGVRMIDGNLAKIVSLPPIVLIQYLLNSRITFRQTPVAKKGRQAVKASKATKEVVDQTSKIEKKNKTVAVIGAGFTGLTAAYQLAKKGYDVTLIEKSDEIGGLVAGFEMEGVPLEKAYHFLYKTDKHIINLANELGIGDTLHFHNSSLSLYYGGKLYPFMTPMDLLRFTPLTLFQRLRAGIIALYLGKVTKWKHFARVTAYDWMTKWGGKRVTEVIWEPILRGKFFNYFDKIAMSYVWSRVYVRANSKDRGDVTEKLGYFDGGFRTFTNALFSKGQELGVKAKTGVTLTSIREQDGTTRLTYADGSEETYDACLATVPNHIFSKLVAGDTRISENYQAKLNSVDYLGVVTMVFMTEKPLTEYYWHNINDIEHPFLVLLSLSALVGPERVGGKHIYYIGAYVPHEHAYFTMTDEELRKLWVGGAQALFPDFTEGDITSSQIFRLRNAQHIVDVDYDKHKIVDYRTVLPGVYLANFSQIFPDDRGTNYAVEEGTKLADIIDDDLSNLN